jgi:hypothetical protein
MTSETGSASIDGPAQVPGDVRRRLSTIADDLIPAAEGMPAASEVDVGGAQLDLVLKTLPDLVSPLIRAVAWSEPPESGTEWVRRLEVEDADAYLALTVAIVGAYYTHPTVRELLGYPGQLGKPVFLGYPEYATEGLLEAVLERGPIYRDPAIETNEGPAPRS